MALRAGALVAALGALSALAVPAHAQPKAASAGAASKPPVPARAEEGPTWATLKPAQRDALKPLERDWPGIDNLRKQKWIDIANRFPSMPPQDQARLQTRMSEWTQLTPLERGQARMNYQEAKQAPVRDRQASWEAYQALPPEQRRELADRAAPPGTAASSGRLAAGNTKTASSARADKLARDGAQAKLNTVPSAATAPPKPVAPTVVQVQPGATTTLISKPPLPPAHQQTGMPKIATTSEFVDTKTLLPQTGAQSATARGTPASGPSARR